jgi:hypothetical protein
MKVRFQTDADFNRLISAGLLRIEPLIDLMTADEASLRGRPDPEVLAHCVREGRMLLSHDARTMPRHFAGVLAMGDSPGLMIVPQSMSIGKAVEDLHLVWSLTEAEEWVNTITRLPL